MLWPGTYNVMFLHLRVFSTDSLARGSDYRFNGDILRLAWENDGRLVAGRTRRPLLVFYYQQTGCRVRCVPSEALKLNGLPLSREQRLSEGDRIEHPVGWTALVVQLRLEEGVPNTGVDPDSENIFVIAQGAPATSGTPQLLPRLGWGVLTCAVLFGSIFGSLWNAPDARPLAQSPRLPVPADPLRAVVESTVPEVAFELKETLQQTNESQDLSVEELLTSLATARRTAEQLARLHPEDSLAVAVGAATNSFYQLSKGIVAEDPESFQAAIDAADRCLAIEARQEDELLLFYRSLANISRREAQSRLEASLPPAEAPG